MPRTPPQPSRRPAPAAPDPRGDPLQAVLRRAVREHGDPAFRSWAAALLRGDRPAAKAKSKKT
jgi:hypothetical protein